MLIKCPECELQVSDKAIACPHCGYPLGTKPSKRKESKKHPRLPNGFGQISKMSNPNLREPYRAMVSVGKKENGRPICKLLKPKAYFKTYNEAYEALVEYNKNPYDLNAVMTMQELYDKWSEQYFEKLSNQSSIRMFEAAWKYCSDIYSMRAMDVRARHLKGVIDNGKAIVNGIEKNLSPGMKSRVKSMFNLMFDYALEYEIVEKNYARTFSIGDDVIKQQEDDKVSHISFTDNEMQTLWSSDNEFAKIMLIQCYTGFRPQEMCLIENSNINLANWTIIGGMKTEAGIDRIVPIHENIRSIITELYSDNQYLIGHGKRIAYGKYQYDFNKTVKQLGLNKDHRPHDCRKQFVTMAKKSGVDEYAIKRIVGHAISDITESVYTDRPIEWLHSEISKIP